MQQCMHGAGMLCAAQSPTFRLPAGLQGRAGFLQLAVLGRAGPFTRSLLAGMRTEAVPAELGEELDDRLSGLMVGRSTEGPAQ